MQGAGQGIPKFVRKTFRHEKILPFPILERSIERADGSYGAADIYSVRIAGEEDWSRHSTTRYCVQRMFYAVWSVGGALVAAHSPKRYCLRRSCSRCGNRFVDCVPVNTPRGSAGCRVQRMLYASRIARKEIGRGTQRTGVAYCVPPAAAEISLSTAFTRMLREKAPTAACDECSYAAQFAGRESAAALNEPVLLAACLLSMRKTACRQSLRERSVRTRRLPRAPTARVPRVFGMPAKSKAPGLRADLNIRRQSGRRVRLIVAESLVEQAAAFHVKAFFVCLAH